MPRHIHPVYRNTAPAYRQFSTGFFARQDRALKARLASAAQLLSSKLRRIASSFGL